MRNRQNEWVFRLNEEFKVSPYAYFFTLTYRDDDLPLACLIDGRKVFPCVCKRDIQLFLKRLRKNTKVKFKYHICAEYGPTTFRPHYHGLLFSQEQISQDDVLKAWSKSDLVYNVFEPMNSRSAAGYVTKYISALPFLPDFIKNSERIYRPFSLCSKGLGLSFLEMNAQLVDKKIKQLEDFVVLDGVKYPMPRYYRDKLFPVSNPDLHSKLVSVKIERNLNKSLEDMISFCNERNIDPYLDSSMALYKSHLKEVRKDSWRKALSKHKFNSKNQSI